MSQNTDATQIVATLDKTTENYAVYESAEGPSGEQDLVGMYVSLTAFGDGEPFPFIEVLLGDDQPVGLSKKKDTTRFGVYESQDGATITGMYVAHDVLGSDETEDGSFEADESQNIGISPASEEEFEQAEEEAEAEPEDADALVTEGESTESTEDEEETESQEDELVIDDDELDLEPAE